MASLFERLNSERPTPTEKANKRPPPIELLLDWLVIDWGKPVITAREIQIYGPNSIRDKNTILNLTRILVERRRLIPLETRRRDKRKWEIARGGRTRTQ